MIDSKSVSVQAGFGVLQDRKIPVTVIYLEPTTTDWNYYILIIKWRQRMLIHSNNCSGGVAAADVGHKNLCLALGAWHFLLFDRWARHRLLHSGRVLLRLSLGTRQDGEVSVSLSEIMKPGASPSLNTPRHIVPCGNPQYAEKVKILIVNWSVFPSLYDAAGVLTGFDVLSPLLITLNMQIQAGSGF